MAITSNSLDGFLASFCFVQDGSIADNLQELSLIAAQLEGRLKYWEVIYVIGEDRRKELDENAEKINRISNLRVITVHEMIGRYRRRHIAASEAIGDVVVLSAFEDIEHVNLLDLAETVYREGEIAVYRRSASRGLPSVSYALLAMVSGHRVNRHDMQTIGFSRQALEGTINRPTATIDLRFEPKHSRITYRRLPCDAAAKTGGQRGTSTRERYRLALELIATSAPRFLKGYAAVSVAVLLSACLYAAYVVGAMLVLTDIEAGWFSTNIVQAGSVAFIAGGMAVLSLGIAEIYERLQGRDDWSITEEISNTSYFAQTESLNVSTGSDGGQREPVA